jgi:hypothetical protein
MRSDRRHLKALARDRNAPQKHVWRAETPQAPASGLFPIPAKALD